MTMRIDSADSELELELPPVSLFSNSRTRPSRRLTKFLSSSTTVSVMGAIVRCESRVRGGV